MEENTGKQHKKQYDWLKGYQFKKGQSGNPNGLKPGTISMKRWAREYLESLPEEERIAFISTLDADIVWKMAEGNPENKSEVKIESTGEFTSEQLEHAKQLIIRQSSNPTPKSSGETSDSNSMGGTQEDTK